MSYYNLSLTS